MLGKILLNFLIIIVEAVAWSYLMNNVTVSYTHLDKDGCYHMRVNEEKPVNAQEALYQMAYDRITEKI